MLKNYASDFYALGSLLKGIHAEVLFHPYGEQVLDEKQIKRVRQFCEVVSLPCDKIGLNLSVIAANRLADQLPKNPNYGYLNTAIPELEQRIEDELASVLFMHVSSSKSGYYTNSEIFGANVTQQFPSATFDIEEAGKCYALGRHTASVTHLMRVILIQILSCVCDVREEC